MWPTTSVNFKAETAFPEALKPGLQAVELEQQTNLLLEALVDETTRKEFQGWADAHRSFVQQSPLISSILSAARNWDNLTPKLQKQAAIVQAVTSHISPFSRKTNYNALIERHHFDFTDREKMAQNLSSMLPLLLEYMEIGLFNQNESFQILSLKWPNGDFLMPSQFDQAPFVKLMKNLTNEHLVNLLSMRESNGNTLLSYPPTLIAILPQLRKLLWEEILPLFQIEDFRGDKILDVEKCALAALPFLLNSMPHEWCLRLLSAHDKAGQTPLHHKYILGFIIPYLLTYKQGKELVEILSLKNKEGVTPLHLDDNIPTCLNLFSSLNPEEIQELFALKDARGTMVLTNVAAWEEFSTSPKFYTYIDAFLKRLPPAELIKTFSEQPALFFAILFMSKNTHPELSSYIEKLDIDQVYPLLKTVNHEGTPFLFMVECFDVALSYLPKLNEEQLCQIFSLHTQAMPVVPCLGEIDPEKIEQWVVPALRRLSVSQLTSICAVKHGVAKQTLLMEPSICKALLPFLVNLKPDTNMELFSQQNEQGNTPLYFKESYYILLPCLQKLSQEQCIQLFSILDRSGNSPLHNPALQHEVVRLLGPLTQEQVLSEKKEWKGHTPLHIDYFFNIALPSLGQEPFEKLKQRLSKQNPWGNGPIHSRGVFKEAFPLIFKEGRPFNEILELLSIENKQGMMPLISGPYISLLYPYFDSVPNNQLVDLFKARSSKYGYSIFYQLPGCLPFLQKLTKEELGGTKGLFLLKNVQPPFDFHVPTNLVSIHYKSLLPLCQKHGFDLSKFETIGISVYDQLTMEFSSSWLTTPKYSTEVFTITKEEYDHRIEQVKSKMEKLWASVHFGLEEGEVHFSLLEIAGIERTSDEVWAALIKIWEPMQKERAWLGTPREENKEALHQFYCLMLVNLESILSKLEQKQNPQETAGFLINIATSCFEGRCATAYQMEIQQARDLLSGEQKSLDGIIKNAAANALQIQIERMVAGRYRGDVHALAQFLYSASMTPVPDSLSQITVEQAQLQILQGWELLRFALRFSRAFPEGMDVNWLKQQTPPEFGSLYLQAKEVCYAQEKQINQEVEQRLLEKLPPEQVERVIKLLRSFWPLSFSLENLKEGDKKSLLQHVFRVTGAAIGKDMELSDFIVDPENFSLSQLEECQQKIEEFMQQQKKSVALINSKKTLIKWIRAIIDFDAHLPSLDPAQKLFVLHVKKKYEEDMKRISEELDKKSISFDPAQQTPSQACEEDRQLAYIKSFLGENPTRGEVILHVLTRLGVIHRKT